MLASVEVFSTGKYILSMGRQRPPACIMDPISPPAALCLSPYPPTRTGQILSECPAGSVPYVNPSQVRAHFSTSSSAGHSGLIPCSVFPRQLHSSTLAMCLQGVVASKHCVPLLLGCHLSCESYLAPTMSADNECKKRLHFFLPSPFYAPHPHPPSAPSPTSPYLV